MANLKPVMIEMVIELQANYFGDMRFARIAEFAGWLYDSLQRHNVNVSVGRFCLIGRKALLLSQ